jgi:5'-phosphate synthase pdxT subunit
MVKPAVGILALQGAFESHANMLGRLGEASFMVRSAAELAEVDALVLPGGESSSMLRLMADESLATILQQRIGAGMPVLATCAGVILLAASVQPEQQSFAAMDVDVVRNAYGRQLHSSVETIRLAAAMGDPGECEGVFIRAPKIIRVGREVEVLGRFGADPVLVRQGSMLAATYHPELSNDLRVHELFLSDVRSR